MILNTCRNPPQASNVAHGPLGIFVFILDVPRMLFK